jgi:hypothetical protein
MEKSADHNIKVSYSGVFKFPIHIQVRKYTMVALSIRQAVELRASLDSAIGKALNKDAADA